MHGNHGYDYGYNSDLLPQGFVAGEIAVLLAAILLTVLLLILVVPEKRRAQLPGFFRGLSDIFNFKGLLIEHIVKALYIFLTLFTIGMGIVMLAQAGKFGGWAILAGLLTMLVGPVLLRLAFEGLMLAILLVRNTIQINGKLDKMLERMEGTPSAQSAPPRPSGPAGVPPRYAPAPPPAPFSAGGTYTGPAAPGGDAGAEVMSAPPETVPPKPETAPTESGAPTAEVTAPPAPPAAEVEKEPAGVGAYIAPDAPAEEPVAEASSSQPAAPGEPASVMVFCTQCGTRYDKSKGGCPNGCVQP